MSRSPRSDQISLPEDPLAQGLATPEPSTAPPRDRSPAPEPEEPTIVIMDALPSSPPISFSTRKIPTILEGPNYRTWKEDAYETLRSLQLWLVTSGDEKEPVEGRYGAHLYLFDQHSIAWKNRNLQASALIYESLSDGIKARIKANDLKEKAKEAWEWLKKEYDAANHLYAVTAWSAFARTHFAGTTPQHWTEHMALLEKNLTDFIKYVGEEQLTQETWKPIIFSAHLQATLPDALREKMKPYFSALQATKSSQATLVDFTPEWISNTINTIMLEEGLSEVQKAQEQALVARSGTPSRNSGSLGGIAGNSGSNMERGKKVGPNRFPACPHCQLRSHSADRYWELEANRSGAPSWFRFKDGTTNTKSKSKDSASPSIDTTSVPEKAKLLLNVSDFSSDFATAPPVNSAFSIHDQARLVEEVDTANLSFDKSRTAAIDSACTSHVFPIDYIFDQHTHNGSIEVADGRVISISTKGSATYET
ncbi:hypothetical protein BT69DRAFT_79753, partial [Atractiella rhizophila]